MNNTKTKEQGLKVSRKGIMKNGTLYIGNLNDYDGMWYWSSVEDMDALAFVSTDRYAKEVVDV